MDSSWTSSGATGEMGTDITSANSILWSSYVSSGWNTGLNNWTTNGDTVIPYLTDKSTTAFATYGATGENGTDISSENAMKQATYEGNSWDFTTPVWYIYEGLTYPWIVDPGNPIIDNIITIDGIDYNLHITHLEDNNNVYYTEDQTNSNPLYYYLPASQLSYHGFTRRKFKISGWTTNSDRLILKEAMKQYTKGYPAIRTPVPYQEVILDGTDFYYITKFETNYKKGNDTVWYSMELIYGGAG